MLLSPAAVDMGGVFITPRLVDFERFNEETIRKVIGELCLSTAEAEAIATKLIDKTQA